MLCKKADFKRRRPCPRSDIVRKTSLIDSKFRNPDKNVELKFFLRFYNPIQDLVTEAYSCEVSV
jgi:hypothetical protein